MNWDDISIRKYIEIQKVLNKSEDPLTTKLELMRIAYDKTPDDMSNLELDSAEFSKMNKECVFLFTPPPLYPVDIDVTKTVHIQGKDYKINLDASKLTAGQYIDIQSFLKDGEAFESIHLVLSVLVVEDKYNVTKVKPRAEMFLDHFPISEAYPISVFFWNLSKALTESITLYLMEKLDKTKAEITEELTTLLQNDGDGLSHLTISQIQMYLNGTTS